MQNLTEFEPGDFLSVRGRNWMIERAERKAPQRVDLVCIDDDAQGDRLSIDPSAEIGVARLTADWNAVGSSSPTDPRLLGAHLEVTRWNTASAADRKLFQAPFRAGIRLDAYQLAPLKKALELPRVNLLVADDVGLGKTIEAGLVARELLLRRRIDLIVISAPASTLLQWQDEMEQKFGLPVTIVDRAHVLETRRRRGFAANPWDLGNIFALSHNAMADETYVADLRAKLGEFRPRSLLILDEAHHAAPSGSGAYAVESQLTGSVRDLASRFEHRLFLTATPHNGHSNAFATLLELLDPQRFTRGISVEPGDLAPIMVRRLKEDLRQLGESFPERIVEPVMISGLPQEAPELRLAGMLAEHVAQAGGEGSARLLTALMQQWLFSSIGAFHGALETYLNGLKRPISQQEKPTKKISDITEIEKAEFEAAKPPVRSAGPSEAALNRLNAMADLAAEHKHAPDARIDWLVSWIEREMLEGQSWLDRRLIIFTEWETTRRWLEKCLHEKLGQLGVELEGRIDSFTGTIGDQRSRDKTARGFNAPFDKAPVRILLCTDAAREGINLQARCFDLIHFDLPWNPSRIEQRNGRIDRKLQPSTTVNCRYFLFTQREEDRVLQALVRKTETIRLELGAAGQIIADHVREQLHKGGIARGSSDEIAAKIEAMAGSETAAFETGDAGGARLERVRKEIASLRDIQERSRKTMGVNADDLARIFEMGLQAEGLQLKAGISSTAEGRKLTFDRLNGTRGWEGLLDDLRPGRAPRGGAIATWRAETEPRDIVFKPPTIQPGQAEPQDVVQVHLEHRLVKRVLGRFLARGFTDRVNRVAAVYGPGSQPRLVLLGRVSLYGPDGRRLHEEVIPVTARWRAIDKGGPELFREDGEVTTLNQLAEALRTSQPVKTKIADQLAESVKSDMVHLQGIFEGRALEAEQAAAATLSEIAEAEAVALRSLLRRQLKRVERERTTSDPAQATLDLRTDEQRVRDELERRQRELDRRSWDDKIKRLTEDLEIEPDRVRSGYGVIARRLEPIGMIYLWPEA